MKYSWLFIAFRHKTWTDSVRDLLLKVKYKLFRLDYLYPVSTEYSPPQPDWPLSLKRAHTASAVIVTNCHYITKKVTITFLLPGIFQFQRSFFESGENSVLSWTKCRLILVLDDVLLCYFMYFWVNSSLYSKLTCKHAKLRDMYYKSYRYW